MRQLLLVSVYFFSMLSGVYAQVEVRGKILNAKLEPLPFASLQIKNTRNTTVTKENGEFLLTVEKGVHEVVVSMVGYLPRVVQFVTGKNDMLNIILEEDNKSLSNVVVTGKYKDPAEDIIRRIIRHKDSIKNAYGAYSCDVYIKSFQEDSFKVKSSKKKKVMSVDSLPHISSFSEVVLKLDYENANKYKEQRIGVNRRGDVRNLFYLTTTSGRFELYDNLIKMPELSPTPFVSPISYSGILAYRYKTLKAEKRGDYMQFTIKVIPGSLSNATISGVIEVNSKDWAITYASFDFPKYHLPQYDAFHVEQYYGWVNNKAWMVTRQEFTYVSKVKTGRTEGVTAVAYKNFELNKIFPKGYFGEEKSVATEATYNRDTAFWNTIRSYPLSEKELKFIIKYDSIRNYQNSEVYKDSVDRAINKTNWKKILYKGQELSYHKTGDNYRLPSVLSFFNPFSFGGLRLQLPFSYTKKNPITKQSYNLYSNISYGLLNKDVNGNIDFTHKYNPFSQANYRLWVSRNFNSFFQNDAIINQLKRTNYYLDNSIGAAWGREVVNGLQMNVNFSYALRRSVAAYKTYSFWDSLLSKSIEFNNNKPADFKPYNALYGSIEIRYTPFQPYIREPKEKIILESKYPTIYTLWKKGIPNMFNSAINFDYWELGLMQNIRLGTFGNGEYTIKTGTFVNKKRLELVDYKFQRRGDLYLFLNPKEYFQSLDSTFPVFKRYYEGHYVNQFNGAIINKVPLLKKLGLREVAGAGFLLAPERNVKYVEVFGGVERVFKLPFQLFQKIKIGFCAAGSIQKKADLRFKIGISSWDAFRNKWN